MVIHGVTTCQRRTHERVSRGKAVELTFNQSALFVSESTATRVPGVVQGCVLPFQRGIATVKAPVIC
jgi:hypothetical protein